MPDPSTWGWLAAGAVGGAFMWLLKLYISEQNKRIEQLTRLLEKSTNTTEKAAKLALHEEV